MSANVSNIGTVTSLDYFFRRLRFSDDKGITRVVDENEMLARAGTKVVLGEPGMGKSELISEMSRRLNTSVIPAVRFMHSADPARFAVPGKPLLIDALDEAMARRDGDAVDAILAKLEQAGSPDFIISCRAREWQARTVTSLRQLYGIEPTIFTLEPLNRMEAGSFLSQRYLKADPDHVLHHLDEHDLSELYRNPLTLSLMGRVAEYDTVLPETRAALFERICRLVWPEHDRNRQDLGVAQITEDQALSAAGAISASLLFSGAEAISAGGPALAQEGDIRLAEIETLPGTQATRAIFSSKLFQNLGPGRAKPLHRVIAEYLGARWLAGQAKTPRSQRRLIAQLQGTGGVPASLRGLHAWLAYHRASIADEVINADPYGFLRYGETRSLTASQATCLFKALDALADDDPYFRASDWDSHTAAGLMRPELLSEIDKVIGSPESNGHFRSLLIEALKGTPLVGNLAPTLTKVMMASDRFYRERSDAAEALLAHHDRPWWRTAICKLRDQGTDDATRLARYLIEAIDRDVSDELLISTIFAEMGVTICPLPHIGNRHTHTMRSYHRIIDGLPTDRLAGVLDLIVDYASLVGPNEWQDCDDVAEIGEGFIIRAIDEKAISSGDAAKVWRWLGIIERSEHGRSKSRNELKSRIDGNDELRRAIQLHALYTARPCPTLWEADITLRERLLGVSERISDVIWFLDRLAGADNKDAGLRQDWCDLVSLGRRSDGFAPELRAAADSFQGQDAELKAFLHTLESPEKPAWQLKRERQQAEREKKLKVQLETERRYYAKEREALRNGELRAIVDPARVYLGLFSDSKRDHTPTHRLTAWLGTDFQDDALVGFEETLLRLDLPTAADVARGFSNGTVYNYCYPILAGLLARLRANKQLSDLSAGIRTIGLLLCYDGQAWCVDEDFSSLSETLEGLVIPDQTSREDFARLWIEPSLTAGCSHVSGLYKLAHDEKWHPTGAALAGGWLATFPTAPENIELELVECLTRSGALTTLASIAAGRASTLFRNRHHIFFWLAVDVLVRFQAVIDVLKGVGANNREFIWFLRNRIQLERHGRMLAVGNKQAKWIVSEFRRSWPYAVLRGTGSGDQNPYDATDFLRALLDRIANDTSVEATETLCALIAEPVDTYTDLIKHMAAEQRQKRTEEAFAPLLPNALGELLTEGPPSNADDLKSLVLEELAVAQKKLLGEDIDQVRDFWNDSGVPYGENRCRDRLAAIIGPELARYGVQRITEADMPKTKRADLAFSCDQLQLPMEVKGQWHSEVWDAASGQLDVQYLIDWRSEQRGIYCVLWFDDQPTKSGRRLKQPPEGFTAPKTANEMRDMLIERIPKARRGLIDVVVLDLATGKR